MAKAKYKRGADGYFATKVWDGTYDPVTGQKNRKNIRTKKSSADLEKKVNKFRAEVEQRKNVRESDITFFQYANSWREVYKNNCENGTKAMYKNIIEKHFIVLEHVRLQDVDRIHLQLALNHADGKERTQQQILLTFKQVLKSAVADHLFPANVMEEIFMNTDSIQYHAKEKRVLTENEKKAVFSANLTAKDKIFLYIIYGCGLRRGEALALTIFDFNLKKKEVTINKSHEFVNDKPVQKEPKTKNGYRTIPIPEKVFPYVEQYINELKANGKLYLFTMNNGKPVTKSSYDKMWSRILNAMQKVTGEQITGLTAHVFRHNYCTNLCYQIPKVSVKKIAQLMGDTEGIVLKVYNHMILEKEDAKSAVNDAMNF
ncbi:MAG: site-specific integrase [Lachnospiraceae bacterium]